MDRMGLATVLLAFALCFGCTETFKPDHDVGTGDVVFDDGFPGIDTPGVDSGTDVPGIDTPLDTPLDTPPGIDTDTTDSLTPDQGPFFRVWATGGASISENGEFRVIGGIRPGNGVPSGDGVHWLVPVFRSGVVANDS